MDGADVMGVLGGDLGHYYFRPRMRLTTYSAPPAS